MSTSDDKPSQPLITDHVFRPLLKAGGVDIRRCGYMNCLKAPETHERRTNT